MMTGAKDKSNRGRGDNGRGAAAVVFGSGPAIKEASRVEGIDTAGARCASVEVWVGARGERACGGAQSLAAKCYSSNNCSEVLQGGR